MKFSELHIVSKLMIFSGMVSMFSDLVSFGSGVIDMRLLSTEISGLPVIFSHYTFFSALLGLLKNAASSTHFFALAAIIQIFYMIWKELRTLNATPKTQRVEVVPPPHVMTLNP